MTGTLTPRESRVLAIVIEAAARGEVCPMNREIAAVTGTSPPSASDAIARLEHKGFIAVARTRASRVVTVLSSGQSTMAPPGMLRDSVPLATLPARERLAELVAEGMALCDTRKALRCSSGRVAALWQQICDGLGSQAV